MGMTGPGGLSSDFSSVVRGRPEWPGGDASESGVAIAFGGQRQRELVATGETATDQRAVDLDDLALPAVALRARSEPHEASCCMPAPRLVQGGRTGHNADDA